MQIKAITLLQPWASLILLGLKKYETRSWATNYRGKLLIHSAKRKIERFIFPDGAGGWLDITNHIAKEDIPYGCIVAIADLTDCLVMVNGLKRHHLSYEYKKPRDLILRDFAKPDAILIETVSNLEQAVGVWSSGRYAWKLENITALQTPIPCKGGQRLWNPNEEIISLVGDAIA